MTETSIKDQIQKLVDLQKIDIEIYELKKELDEKPVVIEDLKEQFEGTKGHLNELEEKGKKIQLARKEKELELQTKEQNIAKTNADLSQIKTNKEYTAKLKEIESLKADKSILEEKILIFFDEVESVQADIDKEKEKLKAEEQNFNARKKEIEGEMKVMQDRIKVLEGQRGQGLDDIDKNFLERYNRILAHKEGLAIVPVINGNSCGGCYMNVTQQIINLLKMKTEIVQCEFCTRIMYLEENL